MTVIAREPLTDTQRRWVNLVRGDADDAIFNWGFPGTFVVLGSAGAGMGFYFGAGALAPAILCWSVSLIALYVVVRVIHASFKHAASFPRYGYYGGRAEKATLISGAQTLRQLAVFEPELTREIADEYWELVKVEKRTEAADTIRKAEKLLAAYVARRNAQRQMSGMTTVDNIDKKIAELNKSTKDLTDIMKEAGAA